MGWWDPLIKRDKNWYKSREVVESNDEKIKRRGLRETNGVPMIVVFTLQGRGGMEEWGLEKGMKINNNNNNN